MVNLQSLAKVKYKYNPHTLGYDKVKVTFKQQLIKLLPFIFTCLLVAIISGFLAVNLFKTPGEAKAQQRIQALNAELKIFQNDLEATQKVVKAMAQRDKQLYRVILDAEPPQDINALFFNEKNQGYQKLVNLNAGDLMLSISKQLAQLQQSTVQLSKSFDGVYKAVLSKSQQLKCIPAIIPIPKFELTAAIGPYGYRNDPVYRTRSFHSGMDFPCEHAHPIRVTGNGVVEAVEKNYWGYGNTILVNHGFGYQTLYAHLSGFNVKVGQKLTRGDVIGFAGSTGKSTGTHLHYEVIKNGEKVNPINYFFNDLTPKQYDEMLKAAQNNNTAFD